MKIGLTSLFLALSLTACSPKVVIKSVPVTPSAELMADCGITPYIITDNASMASAIRSLIKDIGVCTADKRAMRAWKEELE